MVLFMINLQLLLVVLLIVILYVLIYQFVLILFILQEVILLRIHGLFQMLQVL